LNVFFTDKEKLNRCRFSGGNVSFNEVKHNTKIRKINTLKKTKQLCQPKYCVSTPPIMGAMAGDIPTKGKITRYNCIDDFLSIMS